MEIKNIAVEKITTNPLQPRETFDREKIKELANSIKESDLLQPIVVQKLNGTYRIIAGERRWRAFNVLKKKTIPTIVWDVKDDIDALEKSAIENLQREDLTSTERENVITELWKSGKYANKEILAKKLGYRERGIYEFLKAKKIRKETSASEAISTKTLKLIEPLEPKERLEVIKKVERGDIGASRVLEEVRLIKAEKEIKEKYKVEIPKWLKKANFVVEFSKECSKPTNYFFYANKTPKEAWDQVFTQSQLRTIRNSAVALFNELSKFLDKMGWLE